NVKVEEIRSSSLITPIIDIELEDVSNDHVIYLANDSLAK
ncbi:20483_t:CDS:2, partial [Funneliformis geosporum]